MHQALTEIVVLFIIMGFGVILGKKDIVDERTSNRISSLVLSFTFPALIISSMDRDFDAGMFHNSLILLGVTFLICFVIIIVIEAEVRLTKTHSASMSARQFIMLFGNTSFMGIPVLNALYGADGIFYAAVMSVAFNFLMFSYGIYILCRDARPSFKKIFLNSGFIGTAIGLVLFVTPLSLPYIISRPIAWCGDMTIPLALIVAGSIISRNKLSDIVRPAEVWITSFIRLVLYPAVMIAILSLFGMNAYIMSILVIVFATPAPLTAGAFVSHYGGDVFFASKVVVLSNLLSLISMPVLIFIFTEVIV